MISRRGVVCFFFAKTWTMTILLEQFRNYCGLINIARSGFPWEKTTKRPVASVYTHCETARPTAVT